MEIVPRFFHEDYPLSQYLFLHRGRERRKIGGILCIPVAEFLTQLRPMQSLCTETSITDH
jgi:hypothetical protein